MRVSLGGTASATVAVSPGARPRAAFSGTVTPNCLQAEFFQKLTSTPISAGGVRGSLMLGEAVEASEEFAGNFCVKCCYGRSDNTDGHRNFNTSS